MCPLILIDTNHPSC